MLLGSLSKPFQLNIKMNAISNLIDSKLMTPEGLDTTSGANPSNNPDLLADPNAEKMQASRNFTGREGNVPNSGCLHSLAGLDVQALIWHGKNDVRMGEALKPKIVDDHDVLLKITGSTVCGSDMHLLHGAIIEMQSGDILGHECMGLVESVGSAVTGLKVGDRVVAGFNIGCGECFMCRQKLSSACVKTNDSALMNTMYGGRTCGMLGYSHFTGKAPLSPYPPLAPPRAELTSALPAPLRRRVRRRSGRVHADSARRGQLHQGARLGAR